MPRSTPSPLPATAGPRRSNPASKAAMRAVQAAFDPAMEQSGRALTGIGRTLALSV